MPHRLAHAPIHLHRLTGWNALLHGMPQVSKQFAALEKQLDAKVHAFERAGRSVKRE